MKIEIRNLKKMFGTKTAVDIEKADIHDGEILGLVGNNGAGKTTLFRLILDLLNADEGSVMLTPNMTDGTEPTHINPAMSEDWKPFTGSYIDSSFLIDFLTAEEYLEFVGKVSGMSKEDVHKEIAQYEMFMNGEVLGQKSIYATSLPVTSRKWASWRHCSHARNSSSSTNRSTSSTPAVRTI